MSLFRYFVIYTGYRMSEPQQAMKYGADFEKALFYDQTSLNSKLTVSYR